MNNRFKRIIKTNLIFKLVNNFVIVLPVSINISYWWNFGSILGVCLLIQIITGLFLTMHYCSNLNFAFDSIIHIMQDVNYGWLVRIIHINGASIFFICIYIHIGRGIYYHSFNNKKVWIVGVIILLISIGTAFLGYVLPWGQISFWGATVITNLLSAIPYVGNIIVEWIWGGFSINNATLGRFYTFHFILPLVLVILVIFHLVFLHELGSGNPLGINFDIMKISFYPYYILKDLLGFIIIFIIFLIVVLQFPYYFGDPDNFIPANSMVTPVHIQPEWYFLFAYAILRAIPRKLGGVVALIISVIILGILPFLSVFNYGSRIFYPLNQLINWLFFRSFFLLTWVGSRPIEYPFDVISQILGVIYFIYFLIYPLLNILWDEILMIDTTENIELKWR